MSILLKRISDLEKENANLDYMLEMCNGKIVKLEAENARLREALEVILDSAQKDEPCILAIKTVAYTALKEMKNEKRRKDSK